MKTITINIFLLISLLGCRNQNLMHPTVKEYGLIGNVKFLSEKYYNANCDSSLKYMIDPFGIFSIANMTFAKNTELLFTDFLGKDSIFQTKVVYESYNLKNQTYSIQYDKNGTKTKLTKLALIQEDTLSFITIDCKTNKEISTTKTKKLNDDILWQLSTDLEKNFYIEFEYSRNEAGLVTSYKKKMGFDEKQEWQNLVIKYLEFDKLGNWTKRIEYDPTMKNSCMVKTRQIEYY